MKRPNNKNIEIFKKLTSSSDAEVKHSEEHKQPEKIIPEKAQNKKSQVKTKSSPKNRGSSRGG